ncbi:phage tail protein [Vibrio splendidus]|uniref:phage tail-collar fiber domain-containing protein n=1 Tax=Vibrio splendidus TaxID=29497 RepID=UPI00352F7EF8
MANTTDKSILTAAGKALLAQLNAEEKPLIIDKMIFANVPNRPEFPQPDDVVPTDHVVHQEGVEQRGRLSADSVIYSTTLTSDVGPFEFNWTGAYCSEYGVLVTIDHHALTPKSADEPGVAGNTLVRSVVLEYKDIAEITNITVDASSWQYNATPRMKKMDDDVAQAIIDQNGKDWFIEDGFLVTPQASAFNIKAGAGYVSGNRVTLEFDRNVQVPNKPSFIYVDAHREGTPTGEQVTLFDFVVTAEEKDDYTDANGVKHFVCKIAQVLVDGSVSDLRPEGESADKTWVKESEISQTEMLGGNGGLIFGTESSIVGRVVDNHVAIQIDQYPTRDKSTLFTLVPQRNGKIVDINLIERSVTFESDEKSFLSEQGSNTDIDLSRFNLDITGSLDETEKLKMIAAACDGKHVHGLSGKLRVSESIIFETPLSFDFGDVEFLVNRDTDVFTGAVVTVGRVGQTEVLTTTTTLVEGISDLGTVPNVNVGDVVAIWNPVDGSWSGYRDAYRQGEYHRVVAVHPVVILDGPLFDTYPAGSKVFVLPSQKIRVTGKAKVTNEGAAGQLVGIRLATISDSDFTGLDVEAKELTHALIVERGINNVGKGMRGYQQASVTNGLDYGLVISACQNCQFYGDFHAERHGVTYGSGGKEGDAINRDCFASGNITTTGKGNVQGANMHGNVERCGFGGFLQGYNPAGHDSYVAPGTKIVSPKTDMCPVQFVDMKSTKHSLRGAEVVMYGTTKTRGLIDAGGNSLSFNENCVLGGVIDVSNVHAIGPDHVKSVLTLRNRGANITWSINANGFASDVPNAISGTAINPVSGSAPDSVSLSNSRLWEVGAGLSMAAQTKVIGVSQTGEGTISVVSGGGHVDLPITFLKAFNRKPIITITHDRSYIGTSVPIVKDQSVQTTGFTVSAINANGMEWTASATIQFKWKAEVN